MSRTSSYYDVRDVLAQPGCAVCRLKNRAVERYLDGLLWESVNDPGVRRQIRQARGFCHDHAWQLVRPAASLGVAILHRDVLLAMLDILQEARFQAPPLLSLQRAHQAVDTEQPSAATAELVGRLAPQAPCPACKQGAEMEAIYLDTLLQELLGEDGLLATYQESAGLCLPHLRQALARLRSEAVFQALVDAQKAIWQRSEANLGEFIRKSDARFRDEPWGDERDAWLRAIATVAGSQSGMNR
ncbi:MAG: hypothetical protein JXA14_14045 [Anaerolineae bacterium]|nr:hypothetical protein [Anaerolineae bacterium]